MSNSPGQPASVQQWLGQGVQLHQAGRLAEAQAYYERMLQVCPRHADALHLLGVIAIQTGRPVAAIELIQRAIAISPRCADYHSNLAEAWRAVGEPAKAVAACQAALRLNPSLPDAHNNLGTALLALGRPREAMDAFRAASRVEPTYPAAYYNLGNAHAAAREFAQAIAAYRRAIELHPRYAEAHYNLGNALRETGRLDEAIVEYETAARVGRDPYKALLNLGNVLMDVGRLEESAAAFERAGEVRPDGTEAWSNRLLLMSYRPDCDAAAIGAAARDWDRRFAQSLLPQGMRHANEPLADRPLRIGYVSADLCDHPVGRCLLPLLACHDRTRFVVHAYWQGRKPDALTAQLRGHVDHWREIAHLDDEQVAQLVRQDRIDILVDLALHTAGNRLLVFARKPAPVQITFAGYPGTTGLSTIDYRISDPHLDPPGLFEACYAERTLRLPESFWCCEPLEGRGLPVGPLPAAQNGFVTFGCLNSFCKVNEQVLDLWGQVLSAVPGSRLLLLAPEGSARQRVLERLAQSGVAAERVAFSPRLARREYLQLYSRIDVGLDTLPYNGHCTSLDAHWMGVPVVTLVGQTVVGRAGLCQLTNLGLPELIARTPAELVRIAAALAADRARLGELRGGLRERMEKSPLMDGPRFARSMEEAYRTAWRAWCDAQRQGS